MFDRISNLIIKKPRAVIAVWILILLVSVPLALSLDGRLQYDITSFIPTNMESYQANELYQAQFPNDSATQIVVAVQSDNKTQAMLFIRELNDTIASDPNMVNDTGTTSIYAIQGKSLSAMAPTVFSALHDLCDTANDTSGKLYDARGKALNVSDQLYGLFDTVTEASSKMGPAYGELQGVSGQLYAARDQVVAASDGLYQVNDAADLVYMIPLGYASAWSQLYSGSHSVDYANAHAAAAVESSSQFNSIDASVKPLATQYLAYFNQTYVLQTSPASTPMERAQAAMNIMADGFFQSALGAGSTEYKVIHSLLGLGIAGYSSPSTLKSAVIGIVMTSEGLTSAQDQAKLSAIYDMGKDPSESQIRSFVLNAATSGLSEDNAAAAREVYDLGRNPSEVALGGYIVNKASAGMNDTARSVVEAAWSLRHGTKADFDQYVIEKASEGRNASEIESIKEIYAMGRNPSNATIDAYVIKKACEGRNETESQFIGEVYALGPDPSDAALRSYTIGKAADNLNITGSLSFLTALMDMDAGTGDDAIEDFATNWAYTHDYTDPQLFSDGVVGQLASGDLILYAVNTQDEEASLAAHEMVGYIRSDVANITGSYPGVTVYVTGMSAIGVDTISAATQDVDNIDKISVALILVILAAYFLSILTPFVPLAVIGAAIVTGFGALYLTSFTVDLYYLTKTFMIVVMLGAGTDYCVFILSRYAEERNIGVDVTESVRYAIKHAGKSILCSGLTAMIGFASLMVIDNGIFRSMGESMAIAILISMLVALTLIPAVLMLVGDKLFWPRKIYNTGRKTGKIGGVMKRIATFVVKHPGVVLAVTVLLAVPAVWMYFQMETGQDLVSMLPNRLESKMGYNLLNDNFGSGNIDKVKIVITMPWAIMSADGNYSMATLDKIEDLSAKIAAVDGIDKVYSMTRPDGETISYANLSAYSAVEKAYYETVMDNDTGTDGYTTVIEASYEGSPYSPESNAAVDSIRQVLDDYSNSIEGTGTTSGVGGTAVMGYDYQKMASSHFALVIGLVFVGIFIVLAVLLRSAITPVKLFVSMLMGIVWTLAAFTMVFQYYLNMAIIWILPIILFCTLMGLGGDYVVFMMSRVHEEKEKGKSDEESIVNAVEATGPIILLCGVVMAAAFGSMMVSDMAELKEFGFVLSLAIVLDATLMVLVLIPSIMMVAGKYNWWLPFSRKGALQETDKKQ